LPSAHINQSLILHVLAVVYPVSQSEKETVTGYVKQ